MKNLQQIKDYFAQPHLKEGYTYTNGTMLTTFAIYRFIEQERVAYLNALIDTIEYDLNRRRTGQKMVINTNVQPFAGAKK